MANYQPARLSPASLALGLLSLIVMVVTLSASAGSTWISPLEWPSLSPGSAEQAILQIRLTRILHAFTCGGLLALAGSLMQVLLKNPLADPYILGISGGSAVFALSAIVLGLSPVAVRLFGFSGAIVAAALVIVLCRAQSVLYMLLTGLILSALWGAATTLLLVFSNDKTIFGMLYWLIGDLGHADFSLYGPLLLVVLFIVALFNTKGLNLLRLGEQQAQMLGLAVKRFRYSLLVISALSTATAVSIAGNIGFVGLIVPHLIRLTLGSDHRYLLPCAVVSGGCLLVVADMLARTLALPNVLPVGATMAILGAPIFLWILRRTLVLRQG